jgi:hypothetical protein
MHEHRVIERLLAEAAKPVQWPVGNPARPFRLAPGKHLFAEPEFIDLGNVPSIKIV